MSNSSALWLNTVSIGGSVVAFYADMMLEKYWWMLFWVCWINLLLYMRKKIPRSR